MDALQAESVWKISKGKGVTVAVIDNGVNAAHEDLKGNVLKGKDFVDDDDDASPDGEDHGTEMASIIAGHGHGAGGADGVMGLAPEAKILPIRVNISDGSGFADEIRYAVDHGAKVINISMTLVTTQYENSASPEDLAAIDYALNKDVLIVAGAGNDGIGPDLPFPANAAGVVAVGGVDKSGEHWANSNYGPEVMLNAPATRIVGAGSPGNRLRIGDGTSNSTAFVSAAAALLRSKYPDLTAGQIANRLVKTAVLPSSVKGTSLPDQKYGYGAIRPFAALTENIPAGSKYGPLKVPQSISGTSSAPSSGNSDSESSGETEKANQKQMLFFVALGVVALVVVGLIVLLIVKLSRRNKNGSGGPGGPAAYPQYGQQPFPPQQNPYQQAAQPQQNPYQQPTPPPGQWPPQQ
ncbi:type VII secretion-associated serine protease mycosin [Streptomyces sp. NPDC047072]|uniref:type VII secretion-associated serine protease mycosin n=1 Tax=Streptomyces sp. NPDC047072 TaxID=3154809 RepID=UPI0033C49471